MVEVLNHIEEEELIGPGLRSVFLDWQKHGSPTFRLPSDVMEAFGKTRFQFTPDDIRLPFNAIMTSSQGSDPRFFISCFEAFSARGVGKALLVICDLPVGAEEYEQTYLLVPPLWDIEEVFDIRSWERKTIKAHFRSAIAAAAFSCTSDTRFKQRVGSQRKKGKRSSSDPRKEWVIRLPRIARNSGGSKGDGETSTKLKFAHPRQGHMRWTPLGPKGDKRYELRYVRPTIVRPDLPMKKAPDRLVGVKKGS